ncbi:DUF4231 domain-containing protein [Luteococcus sediminum]
MPGPLTDADLPGFWRDADAASMAGQKWTLRYERMRLGGSTLAALGAVFSLGAGRLDLAASVILLGFMVALIAELSAWAHRPADRWYDGRALAESAKTLAWRYAVGADPFPACLNQLEAQALLRERLVKIAEEASERITISSPGPLVTAGMEALRESSFEVRREAYVKGRTEDQHRWYAAKADDNRKRATGWRVALVSAEVVALVLASLRVFGGWNVDLAGLMAALISAGAAWVAVKQFSPLSAAYSMASMELAIQADKLKSIPEGEWSLVAADAEEAISREHTMWLASRTGKRPRL